MTPQALSQTLEDFLTGAADAVVLEDGMVAFDLAQAKYCISGEIHRCLLLLWSAERKVVRRVVDLEPATTCCGWQFCAWARRVPRSLRSAASVIRERGRPSVRRGRLTRQGGACCARNNPHSRCGS
jgi:hypothetical protein